MDDKSFANGNSSHNGNGAVSPGSPVPPWMRSAEWLMLLETKAHQLSQP